MGSHFSYVAYHPPIYDARRQGLATRILQAIRHPLSRIADILDPLRICYRTGHIPGFDVFTYEAWDLDEQYSGHYLGHACGRCGLLLG